MYRLLYLVFILFLVRILPAQQLPFFKPAGLKQLPSSETYNIMQDRKSYIWFSTEAGLCRYNGHNTKVYSAKEGLPERATYNVLEDKKGTLWVTTSRNRLLFYDAKKDSFTEAPFSRWLAKNYMNDLLQLYFARFTGDSTLWLCSQLSAFKVNPYSGTARRELPDDDSLYYFSMEPDGIIPIKSRHNRNSVYYIYKTKKLILVLKKKDKRVVIPIRYTKDYSPTFRVLTAKDHKGHYFIGIDSYLLTINSDLSWKLTELEHPILNLYVDKDDGLWVSFFKGGVTYFSEPGSGSGITSLPDLSVSGVCEDAENGIWCTTIEKGVFYCRNKYIVNYANIGGFDKKSDLLKAIGNRIFTSAEKKDLFELSGDTVTKHTIDEKCRYFTDILPYEGGWLIASKTLIVKTDLNFTGAKKITDVNNVVTIANQLAETGGRVFSVLRGSISKIKGLKYVSRFLDFPSRCIVFTKSCGLVLGADNGAYFCDTARLTTKKIDGIDGCVVKIIETKNDAVLFLTREKDIYCLKDRKLQRISDSLQLPAQRFFDIAQDVAEDLWLASGEGLLRIRRPFGRRNITVYNTLNGLSSDDVSKIAVTGERVFASTSEGLCSFPIDKDFSVHTPIPLYVNNVKVNNKQADLSVKNEFSYYQNNITITYDILSFRWVDQPQRLYYKVLGADTAGHFINGSELSLNNLMPGNYTVTAQAVDMEGRLSPLPATLVFRIKKPFWQTPLFIAGIALLILILVLFIATRVIRQVKKREKEKTRVNKLLAEYQMSALRAQMNPHFIFNSINSIQRYILTNKPDAAYRYLSKFSKLIRLVLNYAEENLISLSEELEIVELYIGLEQLRFENRFSYEIKAEEGLELHELKVPAMIMQPYIENAIWHGLMNLGDDAKGYIGIRLSLMEHVLRITIEDNGVGLKEAAALAAKHHRSKSSGINSRRAEILNIINQDGRGKIVMEDLSDEGLRGTRVIIDIPQHYNDYE